PQAERRRAMGRRPPLVRPVHRRGDRHDPQLLRRRARAGDHDPADRQRDQPRGDGDRALRPQGGSARPRRDALGDDPNRGAPLLPLGDRRRRDARPRARDRRDDRGHDPRRRHPADGLPPVRPEQQPRRRDRQRVRRGDRDAPLGAVRGRARPVRADAAGEQPRAPVRRAGRPRDLAPAGRLPHLQRRRHADGRGHGGGRVSAQGATPELLGRLAVSPSRRRRDRIARGTILGATILALIPLVLIVYYLLKKGLGSWSSDFFTTDPTGNTFFKTSTIGGIKSAILGTIEIVALASAIAIPLGIAGAVWLVEYGRDGRFAQLVRFFVDVLTGVPSIVFGLFIYIVLVVGTGSSYAGYKGSIALALLMLPVVIRSAEVILLLVPAGLRESALALGSPRWRVIAR